MAKAVLGLSSRGRTGPHGDRGPGVDFGIRNRGAGWARADRADAMANVLPALDPADRPLALVHGLVFVPRTPGAAPPGSPLEPARRRRCPPSG